MSAGRRFLLALLLLPACDRGQEPPQGAAYQVEHPRIVSLSPAMTTTLHQVGLGHYIVGRSAFCRNVDHLPVAGDLERINVECLLRLKPTHVFAQGQENDRFPELQRLGDDNTWELCTHPLRDIDDVQEFLVALSAVFPRSEESCTDHARRLDDATRLRHVAARPTMLIISSGSSLLSWGPDTYLGQLAGAAGFDNLAPAMDWQTLSLEDVARLNPDCVLVPVDDGPPDLSLLAAVVPESRLKTLVHAGIDLPGPHLAALAPQLTEMVDRLRWR